VESQLCIGSGHSPRLIADILPIRGTMAAELRWDDTEDIAIALTDKFPEQNPLEVASPIFTAM